MSYDKTKIVNQENYNCGKYVSSEKVEKQSVEIPKLSEEEIEQIISEKYSDKDEKTKTFIKKALRVHGDRYDYSKTIYIKALEKVEIICKEHKSFWQLPSKHSKYNGCPKCANKHERYNKLTTEEFIKRAIKIHGDKYDYSKVEYKNYKTKICIICNNHNKPFEFWQIPNSHLHKSGCPKCAIKKQKERQKMPLKNL